MRITGGSARGRRLAAPGSGRDLIRPTCDRVREALFNLLGARPRGSRVLDLFAGTGALGIEALSRGAEFALFVDRSLTAGRLIETNLRASLTRPAAAFARLDLAAAASLTRCAPAWTRTCRSTWYSSTRPTGSTWPNACCPCSNRPACSPPGRWWWSRSRPGSNCRRKRAYSP